MKATLQINDSGNNLHIKNIRSKNITLASDNSNDLSNSKGEQFGEILYTSVDLKNNS